MLRIAKILTIIPGAAFSNWLGASHSVSTSLFLVQLIAFAIWVTSE